MYGGGARHWAVDGFLEWLSAGSRLPASVREAARQVGVSPSHLQHLLRHQIGRPYTALLREETARRARKLLLEEPHLTVAEVAEAIGVEVRTMCRRVRKTFGVGPSELRRNHRRAATVREVAATASPHNDAVTKIRRRRRR